MTNTILSRTICWSSTQKKKKLNSTNNNIQQTANIIIIIGARKHSIRKTQFITYVIWNDACRQHLVIEWRVHSGGEKEITTDKQRNALPIYFVRLLLLYMFYVDELRYYIRVFVCQSVSPHLQYSLYRNAFTQTKMLSERIKCPTAAQQQLLLCVLRWKWKKKKNVKLRTFDLWWN